MLKFWLYFLSFFYTVNSFSTKEKQEEEIKCYSCDNTIIKIEKGITKNEKEKNANDKEEEKKEENDEPNYTAKAPFASLSCIFGCNCNSYFLCKNCCKNKKNCPKCNYEEQSKKNTNNDYGDLHCNICEETYIKINLGSCPYFYNCSCNKLICKKCYEKCIKKDKKCPFCRQLKNEENNHNVTNEENKIIEVQKNCCQICTECIKDFFINC